MSRNPGDELSFTVAICPLVETGQNLSTGFPKQTSYSNQKANNNVRGGTDLPTIDQNIEKLMFPGIFRCSFIYKTWDKSQFSSKLSFLPPYQGSENFDRFW